MAQVSYGTITITDNNDIEKIYMQYAQSQSNQTAPTSSSDWSTDIPTWRQGYYIWQRTVTKMSGVPLSSSGYGDPVCLTGSTGSTGTTGRGVSSIVTTYCNYGTGTPAADYSGWSTTVPAYDSSKPNYWVKTVITYTSGTPATDTTIYKDNGITSANSTAAAANSTAQTASGKADEAWSKADNAQTVAGNASSAISNLNQYFWRKQTASTNVPAGSYVTNIPGTNYEANPASGGYNSLVQADGIYLRNGITTLSSWTGSALTFNNPSNGSKVIELGSISNVPTLSFYNPSNNTIPMMRLSTNALTFGKPSDGQVQLTIGANGALQSGDFSIAANTSTFASLGTKIDLTYGEIYTPYFRVSQGSVSGGPAAGVYITGNFESTQANIGGTKPWVIKTFKDSKQINLASITGPNSSFIQLGSSGSWLLHSNKIHTAWYISGNYLEYPLLNEKYYDFGMNLPTSLSDKFLYIRYNTGTNLSSIYQNDTNWVYPFYIDASGNVHAPAYYVGSEPLTGGVGSIAEKIINSDSTYGKGSATQPVYIDSNGRPATTTYALNAAGAKGVVTDLANNTTSTNLPTAAAVVSYVTSRGYITSFTDKNVQTNLASNSSTFYIAGPTSTATTTGTLKVITDAKITVDGNSKATITATSFVGSLTGTASRATADSDGNTINSTYLKLTGGNVTGAVTFGSSVSVDELTAGDLVVNGNASFTNNLQANTINGVAVGSSPKFTDTNYYHTTGSWGGTNSLTYTATANGGAGALAFTLATATTGVYGVTKLSSATDSTSTTLAATASAVKAAYDLAASKTNNTGTVTSVQVQASSPLQSSSSTASSTTLSTIISFTNQNVNTVLAGPSSGTTAAAPTFRKLVAADIPDISGTYYLASNPSGYTTNTGTVTSVQVQASSPLTSTASTASSTTLSTTIKFSNQNKNLVLAGPTSGNTAAAPTFRSLVADDIPSISKSKISDFPTSLKNPNAIRLNLFNETAARAAANQSTATSYVDYDGSTANLSFSAAGKNAITSIGISGDTLSWVRADGSSGSSTVTITASVASGATVLTDTNGNAITTTGNTTPVWFDGGVPKDVEGIAFSLLPTGTGASNVAVGNHSHGNITNGGDITTTATIASGDRLVINDESESKINNSSITFGTSTTTFLTNKGTWATPVGTTYTFDGTYNSSSNKAATVSTVTNAINALDGGTIGTPSASKTVTAISQTNGNISVTFGDISITKSQISDFPTSMTPAAHTHTFASLTDKPTTLSGYGIIDAVQYLGVLTSLGSGTPAAATQTYWVDNIPNNTIKMAYNTSGTEYSLIFSRGGSAAYGSVLKWGYNDLYLYMLRKYGNDWKATDWEKIRAGYADSAGSATNATNATNLLAYSSNETTIGANSATAGASTNDSVWFNYRDVNGGTTSNNATQITQYHFGNRKGSTAGVTVNATTFNGALTGNASTATKWASAQTVYVTLGTASTTTTIQGGSSSAQTIGVNGTLAVSNGGTGASSFTANSLIMSGSSTTSAFTTRGIRNNTAAGTLGWTSASADIVIPTVNTIAYWNGAYNGTNSNLAYCNKGAFGTAATYTAATSVGNNSNLPTGAAVQTYVSGVVGNYVTLNTDQTIAANQKTFNGAIRWGTASKYGAAHYDSTLEAIVFSFA